MLYTPYYHDDYSHHHHHHHHHSNFDFSSLCGSSNDDSQESEEEKNNRTKLLAILAFIALVLAGIVGGIYAIYRSALSIKGLFNGEKIASVFCLAAIGGGAYGGVLLGAIIGAALGSAIPVVGTAVGLVLGAIFCSGLFAGLAALISKPIGEYIHKGVIAVEAKNETHLTYAQEKHLKSLGCHLKTIQNMLRAIKREKESTSDEDRKQYLTNLLNNIKNGRITGPVKIGGRLYNPLFTEVEVREESFVSSNAKYLSVGIQAKDHSAVVDYDGVGESIQDRPPPFAPSYERISNEVTASFTPR